MSCWPVSCAANSPTRPGLVELAGTPTGTPSPCAPCPTTTSCSESISPTPALIDDITDVDVITDITDVAPTL
jgi:hypothetical protein